MPAYDTVICSWGCLERCDVFVNFAVCERFFQYALQVGYGAVPQWCLFKLAGRSPLGSSHLPCATSNVGWWCTGSISDSICIDDCDLKNVSAAANIFEWCCRVSVEDDPWVVLLHRRWLVTISRRLRNGLIRWFEWMVSILVLLHRCCKFRCWSRLIRRISLTLLGYFSYRFVKFDWISICTTFNDHLAYWFSCLCPCRA